MNDMPCARCGRAVPLDEYISEGLPTDLIGPGDEPGGYVCGRCLTPGERELLADDGIDYCAACGRPDVEVKLHEDGGDLYCAACLTGTSPIVAAIAAATNRN